MKTTIKKCVLVVVLFGTLISYANNNVTLSINAKRVKVEFKTVKKGHTVHIKDAKGVALYTHKVENNGNYSKLFDVTILENGTYTAELNKDYEIIVKPFTVENGLVNFIEEKVQTVFKPVIRTKNNLVLISKINFENKPLKVTLYYEGDVIFTETVKGKSLLNRVYKLSEKEKGDYKVVIYTDNRKYLKDFII
jgi:hypothetical protein